ncbi:MAG: hypothetical protein AAGB51_02130 [Planctomycetota bacterium]
MINTPRQTPKQRAAAHHARVRRGAVSVMAMILLILFGSLVAAMAIASQGNLRTSATHLYVLRAVGAAETGLSVARSRLELAASRFKVSTSTIDAGFGADFWSGSMTGYGTIEILPPPTGHSETGLPSNLSDALMNMHLADDDLNDDTAVTITEMRSAPASADLGIYEGTDWLVTAGVTVAENLGGTPSEAYQITYAPLNDGVTIRVIVTGYAFGYQGTQTEVNYDGAGVVDDDGNLEVSEYITRVVTQDYQFIKSVDNAIVSPAKVMLGKNVSIRGDLALTYTDTSQINGDPLNLKDDFEDIDPDLDLEITNIESILASYDIDGDSRLRVGHPVEGAGIPLTDCYPLVGVVEVCSGSSEADAVKRQRSDVTGDGYWDIFDVVVRLYDTPTSGDNGDQYDNRIDIATEWVDTNGSPLDPDLALLIDSANPDRNGNGVYGFLDLDGNGLFNGLDSFVDVANDSDNNPYFPDVELGYLDGYLDFMDEYAKVDGTLSFAVSEADWTNRDAALNGPVVPIDGDSAVEMGVGVDGLPTIDAASFAAAASNLAAASNGLSFWTQVGDELGVAGSSLQPGGSSFSPYTESKPEASYDPINPIKPAARYLRIDLDNDLDGLPDNHADSYVHFEKMPFNGPNFADYYYRPVFEHMVFKDVTIPMGLNALFVNCTFIGVTRIETHYDNSHAFFNEYGRLQLNSGASFPTPTYDREIYGDDPSEDWVDIYQPVIDATSTPENIRLRRSTTVALDKADFLQSEVNASNQSDFNLLPEPIIVGSDRITDTRQLSSNLRFHDCLVVGSIVSDAVAAYTHVRNKLQFTGATRFAQQHPDYPNDTSYNPDEADMDAISRSTLMVPNFSVDIGHFNAPSTQNVQLQGAIIAGILDIRGNCSLFGALLMTFAPQAGVGPLSDYLGNAVGNPANFNASIGYFGPDDGDEESLDPLLLPEDSNGRIAGWDTDGDGLADVSPFEPQPAGSTIDYFEGYGKVIIEFDPDMALPDGIMIPMNVRPVGSSYREGSY